MRLRIYSAYQEAIKQPLSYNPKPVVRKPPIAAAASAAGTGGRPVPASASTAIVVRDAEAAVGASSGAGAMNGWTMMDDEDIEGGGGSGAGAGAVPPPAAAADARMASAAAAGAAGGDPAADPLPSPALRSPEAPEAQGEGEGELLEDGSSRLVGDVISSWQDLIIETRASATDPWPEYDPEALAVQLFVYSLESDSLPPLHAPTATFHIHKEATLAAVGDAVAKATGIPRERQRLLKLASYSNTECKEYLTHTALGLLPLHLPPGTPANVVPKGFADEATLPRDQDRRIIGDTLTLKDLSLSWYDTIKLHVEEVPPLAPFDPFSAAAEEGAGKAEAPAAQAEAAAAKAQEQPAPKPEETAPAAQASDHQAAQIPFADLLKDALKASELPEASPPAPATNVTPSLAELEAAFQGTSSAEGPTAAGDDNPTPVPSAGSGVPLFSATITTGGPVTGTGSKPPTTVSATSPPAGVAPVVRSPYPTYSTGSTWSERGLRTLTAEQSRAVAAFERGANTVTVKHNEPGQPEFDCSINLDQRASARQLYAAFAAKLGLRVGDFQLRRETPLGRMLKLEDKPNCLRDGSVYTQVKDAKLHVALGPTLQGDEVAACVGLHQPDADVIPGVDWGLPDWLLPAAQQPESAAAAAGTDAGASSTVAGAASPAPGSEPAPPTASPAASSDAAADAASSSSSAATEGAGAAPSNTAADAPSAAAASPQPAASVLGEDGTAGGWFYAPLSADAVTAQLAMLAAEKEAKEARERAREAKEAEAAAAAAAAVPVGEEKVAPAADAAVAPGTGSLAVANGAPSAGTGEASSPAAASAASAPTSATAAAAGDSADGVVMKTGSAKEREREREALIAHLYVGAPAAGAGVPAVAAHALIPAGTFRVLRTVPASLATKESELRAAALPGLIELGVMALFEGVAAAVPAPPAGEGEEGKPSAQPEGQGWTATGDGKVTSVDLTHPRMRALQNHLRVRGRRGNTYLPLYSDGEALKAKTTHLYDSIDFAVELLPPRSAAPTPVPTVWGAPAAPLLLKPGITPSPRRGPPYVPSAVSATFDRYVSAYHQPRLIYVAWWDRCRWRITRRREMWVFPGERLRSVGARIAATPGLAAAAQEAVRVMKAAFPIRPPPPRPAGAPPAAGAPAAAAAVPDNGICVGTGPLAGCGLLSAPRAAAAAAAPGGSASILPPPPPLAADASASPASAAATPPAPKSAPSDPQQRLAQALAYVKIEPTGAMPSSAGRLPRETWRYFAEEAARTVTGVGHSLEEGCTLLLADMDVPLLQLTGRQREALGVLMPAGPGAAAANARARQRKLGNVGYETDSDEEEEGGGKGGSAGGRFGSAWASSYGSSASYGGYGSAYSSASSSSAYKYSPSGATSSGSGSGYSSYPARKESGIKIMTKGEREAAKAKEAAKEKEREAAAAGGSSTGAAAAESPAAGASGSAGAGAGAAPAASPAAGAGAGSGAAATPTPPAGTPSAGVCGGEGEGSACGAASAASTEVAHLPGGGALKRPSVSSFTNPMMTGAPTAAGKRGLADAPGPAAAAAGQARAVSALGDGFYASKAASDLRAKAGLPAAGAGAVAGRHRGGSNDSGVASRAAGDAGGSDGEDAAAVRRLLGSAAPPAAGAAAALASAADEEAARRRQFFLEAGIAEEELDAAAASSSVDAGIGPSLPPAAEGADAGTGGDTVADNLGVD
jgi:hypothetical protein